MRPAILAALPVLAGFLCGATAAQSQQQTNKPPIGSEPADPARMAADKADATIKPNPGGAPVDSSYVIGPEDVIYVWCYQQPSLNNVYAVRTDGMVSIPLIGEVKAGGLTTGQMEASIINKLKSGDIVIEPNVTVGVNAVHSKKVYIEGDGIAHTGIMDLVVDTRVSEVITWAGGFKDFAKKKSIRIVRAGKPGDKPEIFHYNAVDVSKGKKLEQNILVKPGDHIYVD